MLGYSASLWQVLYIAKDEDSMQSDISIMSYAATIHAATRGI